MSYGEECYERFLYRNGLEVKGVRFVAGFQQRAQGDRRMFLEMKGVRFVAGFQGDREGRPYDTTKRLAKPVYCTGDPRGRPGFRGFIYAA